MLPPEGVGLGPPSKKAERQGEPPGAVRAPVTGLAGPEARYEQRESVELAFIAALQHLPARQRAVLILRDVLGFSARETAAALEMSSPGVDSALQRAHKAVDERLPDRSQQAVLGSLGDQGLREIVDRYVDAFERADVDAVDFEMLADRRRVHDAAATHLVPRARGGGRVPEGPCAGEEKPCASCRARANGQLAFGNYRWDEEWQSFLPRSISVLTLDGQGIAEITTFLDPELRSSFGLPDQIEP